MCAYYRLLDRRQNEDGATVARYMPNIHAQGAWNEHEQHMAPVTGVLCAELERHAPRDDVRVGRISLDILGLIAFDEFAITTATIRAGRTIELVESRLQAQGKTCVVARSWRMATTDSRAIAALEDGAAATSPQALAPWAGMAHWGGGYIASIETRTDPRSHRAGRGLVWVHNALEMVEGQATSDFVRLMGMVDTANGVAPRLQNEGRWAFPNLDLQIHLYRLPRGQWLGMDAMQQFGEDGIGLSSAVLYDAVGSFGRSEQILTLRPLQP